MNIEIINRLALITAQKAIINASIQRELEALYDVVDAAMDELGTKEFPASIVDVMDIIVELRRALSKLNSAEREVHDTLRREATKP